MVFRPMCRLRAVSLPFCMAGTRAAASAHSTVISAPAYRWGPGNSLPARHEEGRDWGHEPRVAVHASCLVHRV